MNFHVKNVRINLKFFVLQAQRKLMCHALPAENQMLKDVSPPSDFPANPAVVNFLRLLLQPLPAAVHPAIPETAPPAISSHSQG